MARQHHAIAHAVGMALEGRGIAAAPVGRALRQLLADHGTGLALPDPFANRPEGVAWPPLRRRCN
ncbi:MAG: hypothetical protein Tsb0016_26000 [Sphingomonadales bacterium]